jgi:hypothetical protein
VAQQEKRFTRLVVNSHMHSLLLVFQLASEASCSSKKTKNKTKQLSGQLTKTALSNDALSNRAVMASYDF